MLIRKKYIRTDKGAVTAEAALVLPLLVAVLLFIIEFGIVLYLSNSMNQIARTAARYASVTANYTQSATLTASGASAIVPDITKLTLTISPTPGSMVTVGTSITVTAQYNYTPVVNPFALLPQSTVNWAPVVKSTSVARAEVASG